MHLRSLLLALVLASALPAAATAEDRYLGDWFIDALASTPWADGQQRMTIRPSSEAEVRGFAAGLPQVTQSSLQGACWGSGEPGAERPAIAYYAMTFTWSGGGTNMGCRSKSASGDLLVYGPGNQQGELRFFKDRISGQTRFGGDWGNQQLVAWRAEEGGTGCRAANSTRSVAKAAAITDVHVDSCIQGCEVSSGPSGSFQPVERNSFLTPGQELSCDPEGHVVLRFADGSTIEVFDQTTLKLSSFFTEGGVVKVELLLKNGRVQAKVEKSETTKSDWRIRDGAGHSGSVRGTTFGVFVDPIAKAATFSVTEGVVAVKAGSRSVDVTAGQEVEAVGKTISKPTAFGLAGARGGISRLSARELVLAIVANTRCNTSVPRGKAIAIKPVKNGWAVAAPLTGKVRGTARWTVIRGKVKAANPLARRVARNCR